MLKLGIFGICGKMGKMVASLADRESDVIILSGLEHPDHEMIGKPIREAVGLGPEDIVVTKDPEQAVQEVDAVIDFTLPASTMAHLGVCLAKDTPIVICATGLSSDDEEKISDASRKIPVVFSPNMSPGMNLVFDVVAKIAGVLGKDFTIKVDETHHVHKVDSPSGTAKMIARIIEDSCGKKVPVEAKREGEVIGNHGIIFDGEFESIEIRHDAKTRQVFAGGALAAAKYLKGKSPALYRMSDVLGLG